jgi:sugar phosphate isomerase/epimerase
MNRCISLHAPSLPSTSTVDLVHAAANAGFDACGIRLIAPPGIASPEDLIGDVEERERVIDALATTGLKVLDVEVFLLGSEAEDWRHPLEAARQLGANNVLAVSFDNNADSLTPSLNQLAAQCTEFELNVGIEPITYSAIPDVKSALALVSEVDAHINIIIDALQFFRSAASLEDLAQVPEDRIPYVQLSDAASTAPSSTSELRHEARSGRLAPGQGQLPLKDLLKALPSDIPVSLEVPNTEQSGDHQSRADKLAASLLSLLK